MTRRRPAHRLTSALIGAIITALGVLTAALLSGKDLDTELIAIVTLASVGGWLLITAVLSSRSPRSGAWAPEPWPSGYARNDSVASSEDRVDAGQQTPAPHVPPLTAAARKAATAAKRADAESALPKTESD
ncbi:MAG: hypothetical protein HGA51_03760 [Demequinaceae bacterium]|nr:hypothetical protein [Demequinaceae bacterium]